jgi:arylsulfatase A-like enzyme
VPLIVAGPAVRGGVVSAALVSLHDLAATFVERAGAAPMPDMEARSLSPVLAGDAPDGAHRDGIVSGLHDWRLAYDGRHKLVSRKEEADLLFDLEEDPWEDRDLAAERPSVAAELRALLTCSIPDWST